MTYTAPTQHQEHRIEPYKNPLITKIGISVAFGYLATKFFTNINPIAGAIFTGMYSILDSLTSKVDNLFSKFLHSTDSKFLKIFLCGAGSFLMTNAFMKLTLMEGIKLTALPLFSVASVASVIAVLAGLYIIIGAITAPTHSIRA